MSQREATVAHVAQPPLCAHTHTRERETEGEGEKKRNKKVCCPANDGWSKSLLGFEKADYVLEIFDKTLAEMTNTAGRV